MYVSASQHILANQKNIREETEKLQLAYGYNFQFLTTKQTFKIN